MACSRATLPMWDNVVHGNLLAADAPGISGQVFNVAHGRTTNLLELVADLNQLLGTDIDAIHEPPRVGDVRESMADITRVRQEMGYEPQVSFAAGLARTVEHYRATTAKGS